MPPIGAIIVVSFVCSFIVRLRILFQSAFLLNKPKPHLACGLDGADKLQV